MSLIIDFFGINMPFGIVKNDNDEWLVFNSKFAPIGWNNADVSKSINSDDIFKDIPIRTHYKNLTEDFLMRLADRNSSVEYDKDKKIKKILLYDSYHNPMSNEENWNAYMRKIRILYDLKVFF